MKNDIRLRYTSSPHRGDFITYSNCNLLIKSISEPIDVNGLLDMMMKRFDETLTEIGSFQVSKPDYESRCRSLIKRFELGSKLVAHS